MNKLLRGLCVFGLATSLVSCVATRRPVVAVPVAQQAAVLAALPGYSLAGRVAITRVNAGLSAALQWEQRKATSDIRLAGPLGLGATQIHYDGSAMRITTSRGDKLEGEAAEQVLAQQLGFAPPLAALRYWVLGLPAPNAAATAEVRDANGQLTAFTQLDWQLQYEAFRPEPTASGTVQMPARLLAQRDDLRLRLVVDSWQLP